MNAGLTLLCAAASTSAFSLIARTAARRRGLSRCALPPGLCALTLASAPLCTATGAGIAGIVACSAAVVAGHVDARTGVIFNPLTVALLVASFAVRAIQGTVILGAFGSAEIGGLLLVLQQTTNGRGLGRGDVKFGFALGAALGPIPGLIALGCAFVAGAAYGLRLLAAGRADRKTAIRFGPFLALGTFIAVFAEAWA
jgi:prepilin signal peptidase PulO-like enzyme (type II secretory pathway)